MLDVKIAIFFGMAKSAVATTWVNRSKIAFGATPPCTFTTDSVVYVYS